MQDILLKPELRDIRSQNIKVVIPCCKSYEFILLKDIVRCEGLQNYTKIFLTNGASIVSSQTIGIYKTALEGYNFFNCHKSHLINNNHIIRYHKDGEVEMLDASKIPVARRRKEAFFEQVIDFLSLNGK